MTQQEAPNQHSHWNIETTLVHSGRGKQSDGTPGGIPTVQPIYATTTYTHASTEKLDQAFSGTTTDGEMAYVYARQGNPSTSSFEETMTQVEKGVGAVACSSGMAAIHIALLAAGLTTGAKIVASQDLYGQTITLIRKLFSTVGAQLVLTDLSTPKAIDVIREEEPDIIFAETVSNPLVKVADLAAISAVAHEVNATTIIDSTFSTPYILRPIEHGCDLVVHSATKYLGGHGDSTGGIVISATNVLLDQLRAFRTLTGATLSPFESHLLQRGLRTLPLRMERHCQNALQVAQYLQGHPAVERVYYPGLLEHPQHALARQQAEQELYGGLLSFELKEQSREAVFRFMNRLQLCISATSLGDVFTLISYPPISSHRNQSAAELQKMGIHAGCIRISVGVEKCEDIIHDLAQALA
jgi:Cystathionine beta-lyases/cystathionine gamma-synthases